YDLFVGIPIHRVPAVVAESGLAENGWVAVDRDTLMTPCPDVYAVGDVVGLPMAKAGVFAENSAGVVAEDIVARLRGETSERCYSSSLRPCQRTTVARRRRAAFRQTLLASLLCMSFRGERSRSSSPTSRARRACCTSSGLLGTPTRWPSTGGSCARPPPRMA